MFALDRGMQGSRMKPETDATGVSREVAAGLTLLIAAVLALLVANSPFHETYEHWLEMPVSVGKLLPC
jgi:NhaA family Na+:H+ antiporter